MTSPVKVSQQSIDSSKQIAQASNTSRMSDETRSSAYFGGAIGVDGGSADVARVRLQSLVTFEQVASMYAADAAPRLAVASVGLQGLKATLIGAIYGKQRLEEWQRLVAMRGLQDAELARQLAADPKLRREFQEIEDAVGKGF